MSDPQAPVDSPPPRTVEPWTRVTGHQVLANPGSATAFCRCGERMPKGKKTDEWRVRHLSEAWPVLIERLDGESLRDWRSRVWAAREQAREAAEPEMARLPDVMQVWPGQPYPVVSDSEFSAEERLEVLDHQLSGRPFDRMGEFD